MFQMSLQSHLVSLQLRRLASLYLATSLWTVSKSSAAAILG